MPEMQVNVEAIHIMLVENL